MIIYLISNSIIQYIVYYSDVSKSSFFFNKYGDSSNACHIYLESVPSKIGRELFCKNGRIVTSNDITGSDFELYNGNVENDI